MNANALPFFPGSQGLKRTDAILFQTKNGIGLIPVEHLAKRIRFFSLEMLINGANEGNIGIAVTLTPGDSRQVLLRDYVEMVFAQRPPLTYTDPEQNFPVPQYCNIVGVVIL